MKKLEAQQGRGDGKQQLEMVKLPTTNKIEMEKMQGEFRIAMFEAESKRRENEAKVQQINAKTQQDAAKHQQTLVEGKQKMALNTQMAQQKQMDAQNRNADMAQRRAMAERNQLFKERQAAMKPYPTVAIAMTDVWASPKRFELVFSEDDRKRIYEFLCSSRAGRRDGNPIAAGTPTRSCTSTLPGGARRRMAAYDCQDELQQNAPLIYDAWLTRARQDIRRAHAGALLRQRHGLRHGRHGAHRRQRARQLHCGVLSARALVAELGRRDDVLQQAGEPRRWPASIRKPNSWWCSTAASRIAPTA